MHTPTNGDKCHVRSLSEQDHPGEAEGIYLRGFAAASQRGETFPAATELIPHLTLSDAYRLQDRIVAARVTNGDQLVGFKSGLMSAKSMATKQAAEPLTGALFASGELQNGAQVPLSAYRRAALEMKLGYVLAQPVSAELRSTRELMAVVRGVAPVVDLPDIAYRDADTYTGPDMIAANISSARFVRGEAREATSWNLDALRVELQRDGEYVTHGFGSDSMEDQWRGLLTVVNLLVARGAVLRTGQLILTGKIGDKVALESGAYVADYGELGAVRFHVGARTAP